MRAAYYTEPGPAYDVIQIGEIDKPQLGSGDVLVRLRTSGVNPSDIKSRTTMFDRVRNLVPVIPHYDGAGEVEAVGDGVINRSIGDRVWVALAQWRGSNGSCAEYVVLNQNLVLSLPDNTSFVEGACIGVPVLTAMQALSVGPSIAKSTVLVTGGATSVGNYTIQLAKHSGARVLTTIGGEEAGQRALEAGADEIINYKSEEVVDRVSQLTNAEGVDYLVDMDMSFYAKLYPELVTRGGFIAAYGSNTGMASDVPTHAFCTKDLTLRGFLLLNLENSEIERLGSRANELLAAGKLKHNIGATFPFDQTADAHDTVEQGRVTGNVVIEIA